MATGLVSRHEFCYGGIWQDYPKSPGGATMVDRSRSGLRCRSVRYVNSPQGALPRFTRGTIRYEMENLGRRLVFVDWDHGISVPVFPDEIEVLGQEGRLETR